MREVLKESIIEIVNKLDDDKALLTIFNLIVAINKRSTLKKQNESNL